MSENKPDPTTGETPENPTEDKTENEPETEFGRNSTDETDNVSDLVNSELPHPDASFSLSTHKSLPEEDQR